MSLILKPCLGGFVLQKKGALDETSIFLTPEGLSELKTEIDRLLWEHYPDVAKGAMSR